MGELARLQSAFARALVADDLASFAPGVRGEAARAERFLSIYRNAVFANWRKALASTFPVVERLVGEGHLGVAVGPVDAEIAAHDHGVGRQPIHRLARAAPVVPEEAVRRRQMRIGDHDDVRHGGPL